MNVFTGSDTTTQVFEIIMSNLLIHTFYK